jgi:DNA repair protein RecO (recombination protein O)
MKQIATQALVLGRIDFGESGRILTLLTSDHGKIGAIAKGVRKPKSKLAGGVELFGISDIVYFEGKSDIKTLISAQLKTNYSHINEDISRTMTAYDVLKYINLYTESVCEDTYFYLVRDVFEALNNKAADVALIWAWFGVRLLEISGTALNSASDSRGERLNASDLFNFEYQDMAFLPAPHGPYTSAHIKLLRLCQSASLEKLETIGGVGQPAEDIRQLIIECIKYNN